MDTGLLLLLIAGVPVALLVIVAALAILASALGAASRNAAAVGAVCGGGLAVVGLLVLVLAHPFALISLGGGDAATRMVWFEDVNAITNRQMVFQLGGGLMAAAGMVMAFSSIGLAMSRRE